MSSSRTNASDPALLFNGAVAWIKPPQNVLKVNVERDCMVGWGCIVRDCSGIMIRGFSKAVIGSFTVKEAEAMGFERL
ncbi:conserved hypothetical protein [Ricinus communis]|uniref:RNase H type-1 domain-containing protein n=1 Tax=Ricinus communis TaxID=3988 RepID=B9RIM9_RICCO|nr:conserved hypothetical protein [Ricinus communis]